ncbi:MAG: hypothetical protein QNK23_10105 [Crocinitomicaceae bacterium]|nr:hypothetical protein [Crocinitomicaceae bacterium]
MKKSLLFTIGKGILLGAFLFFIPKILLLFIIPFILFRIFFFRKMKGGNFWEHKLAFADKVRSMSEEDYEQFKTTRPSHNCR